MRINLDKAFRRLDRLYELRSTKLKGRPGNDPEVRATYDEQVRIECRLLTHLDDLIAQAVGEPEKPLDPAIDEIATSLYETYDEELEEEGRYGVEYLSDRISQMQENYSGLVDGAGAWLFGVGVSRADEDQLEQRIRNWTTVRDRLEAEIAASPEAQDRERQREQDRLERRQQWQRAGEAAHAAWLEGVQPHIDRMAPPLAERHGKPLDLMKRFIAWHANGWAEWYGRKANNDAEGCGLADLSVETLEQQIFDPAEYHRREAASHLAEAERGDAASLINWDAAVTDRWDEFERELEPA